MIVIQMGRKGDLKDRMNRKENTLKNKQIYYDNQTPLEQQSFLTYEAS
jgi:hypothetical protein